MTDGPRDQGQTQAAPRGSPRDQQRPKLALRRAVVTLKFRPREKVA